MILLLAACELGSPDFDADLRWGVDHAEAGWEVVRLDYRVRGRSWANDPVLGLELRVNDETWTHELSAAITPTGDGLEALWMVPVPAEATVVRARVTVTAPTGTKQTPERSSWAVLTIDPTPLEVSILGDPGIGEQATIEVQAPPYWMADPTLIVTSGLVGQMGPGTGPAPTKLVRSGAEPLVARVEVTAPDAPGTWQVEAQVGRLAGLDQHGLALVPDELALVARDADPDAPEPAREQREELPCREMDVLVGGGGEVVTLNAAGGRFASGTTTQVVTGERVPVVVDETATAFSVSLTPSGAAAPTATAVLPLAAPSAEEGVLTGPSLLPVGSEGTPVSSLRGFVYDGRARPVDADPRLVVSAISDPTAAAALACGPVLDEGDVRCDPTGWESDEAGGCLLTPTAPTVTSGELSQALASVCFAGDVVFSLVARSYVTGLAPDGCQGDREVALDVLDTVTMRLE